MRWSQKIGQVFKLTFTICRDSEALCIKQLYTLWYKAEIEFLRFVWWSGAKQSIYYNNFEVKTHGIISSGETRNAGDRQNISGVIHFEKSERGWWGEPGKIKLTQ